MEEVKNDSFATISQAISNSAVSQLTLASENSSKRLSTGRRSRKERKQMRESSNPCSGFLSISPMRADSETKNERTRDKSNSYANPSLKNHNPISQSHINEVVDSYLPAASFIKKQTYRERPHQKKDVQI